MALIERRPCAGEGAKVVVNDLDPSACDEVAAEIHAQGGSALAYAGSVTEPALGQNFVQAAIATEGGLDIIGNNAGYASDGVIQNMTGEQFKAMPEVHLRGPFRVLRAAAGYS